MSFACVHSKHKSNTPWASKSFLTFMQISSAKRSSRVGSPGVLVKCAKRSIKQLNKNGDSMEPWNKPRVRLIGVCDSMRFTSNVEEQLFIINEYIMLISLTGHPLLASTSRRR